MVGSVQRGESERSLLVSFINQHLLRKRWVKVEGTRGIEVGEQNRSQIAQCMLLRHTSARVVAVGVVDIRVK